MRVTTADFRLMVTGHRDLHGHSASVSVVLHDLLARMRARRPKLIAVSGMAVGTDLIFAEAALNLDIPLIAAVPLPNQSDPWPRPVADRWERAIAQAVRRVEVWQEPGYKASGVPAKLHQRNLWLLDHSEAIVAVWDGRQEGSGTWKTIREARRRGRSLMILDPATGTFKSEPARPV